MYSSLSSFQGRQLQKWSALFLNYWHLAPPFPAPEWSFLIKLTSFAFPQAVLLEERITEYCMLGSSGVGGGEGWCVCLC